MIQPSATEERSVHSSSINTDNDSSFATPETSQFELPTPLERLSIVYDEKTIVNEIRDLLSIDDEEIFDDFKQPPDEEDMHKVDDGDAHSSINRKPSDFIHLRRSNSNSSTFSRIEYVDTIRKERPLPKIPDRRSSKAIPPEVSRVLEESLDKKRLSAQQLFEIFKKLRLEEEADNRSVASDDSMYSDDFIFSRETSKDEDDHDDDEQSQYGGICASKLEMPTTTMNSKVAVDDYYSEYVNPHREITPVMEEDEEWEEDESVEEDQQDIQCVEDDATTHKPVVHEITIMSKDPGDETRAELRFSTFQEKHAVDEDGIPNYVLVPTDESESSSARRASVNSMSAPSLVSEASHATSGNNSQRSGHSPSLTPLKIESNDSQLSDSIKKNRPQSSCMDNPDINEQRYDTVNDISSLYATPTDELFIDQEQFAQQPKIQTRDAFCKEQAAATNDVSLCSDVKRLSQLNKALSTPELRHSELFKSNTTIISDSKEPTHLEEPQPQPTIGESPYNRKAYIRTPVTSLSLTHDKNSLKIYRRMATKTNDRNIQYTYTKYLMQLVSFYAGCDQRDIALIQTRNRLQEEAEYWIDRLAKSNYGAALYTKGQWHRHCGDVKARGVFVGAQYRKANHEKAFKCFQLAAKHGSIEAYYELAECWMVRKDYRKTLACYKYAASKSHVLSLYKLANIHIRGLLNQKKDIHKGLIYLRQAADANHPDSAQPAYDFACILLDELDTIDLDSEPSITSYYIAPDHQQAAFYLKKADRFGLVSATSRLGRFFIQGYQNFPPDHREAFKCFAKAAKHGHESSMIELSQFYKTGIPGLIRPHLVLAFQWCQKAAENGNDEAEFILGTYYEDGIGVHRDEALAKEWFSKSAAKGYPPALKKLYPSTHDSTKRSSYIEKEMSEADATFQKHYPVESNRYSFSKPRKLRSSDPNCRIM